MLTKVILPWAGCYYASIFFLIYMMLVIKKYKILINSKFQII